MKKVLLICGLFFFICLSVGAQTPESVLAGMVFEVQKTTFEIVQEVGSKGGSKDPKILGLILAGYSWCKTSSEFLADRLPRERSIWLSTARDCEKMVENIMQLYMLQNYSKMDDDTFWQTSSDYSNVLTNCYLSLLNGE